jgi:predicted Fe-Mo cluster-binding NifX family protein
MTILIRPERHKGMKIALSIWKDYISTVFDTADQLLVLENDGTNGQKRTMVKLNAADVVGRANQIKEKQIGVLICGAISRPLEASLISLGIRVYAFVRGPVEDILAAYQNGSLDQAVFALPGCRGRGYLGNRRQNRRRRNNWR